MRGDLRPRVERNERMRGLGVDGSERRRGWKDLRVHVFTPADLPGEPFGDPAHLIDHTVQMLDQTGGTGALISTAPDPPPLFDAPPRGFTTLTAVRPGAHDIIVMVAAQDPPPLTAYGPHAMPSRPRSASTDRRGSAAGHPVAGGRSAVTERGECAAAVVR